MPADPGQPPVDSDVRRLIGDLRRRAAMGRGSTTILGGVENYSGIVCAHCGEITAMFPPAPPEESIWTDVEQLGSLPFSPQAACDADHGKPVMLTGAVREQVAVYESLAGRVRDALASPS